MPGKEFFDVIMSSSFLFQSRNRIIREKWKLCWVGACVDSGMVGVGLLWEHLSEFNRPVFQNSKYLANGVMTLEFWNIYKIASLDHWVLTLENHSSNYHPQIPSLEFKPWSIDYQLPNFKFQCPNIIPKKLHQSNNILSRVLFQKQQKNQFIKTGKREMILIVQEVLLGTLLRSTVKNSNISFNILISITCNLKFFLRPFFRMKLKNKEK